MDDPLPLLVAFALGAVLGWLHFYGLWLTVRRLATERPPVLRMLASTGARLAVLLVGLYLVGDGDWRRLLTALAGILLMRALLTHRLGRSVPTTAPANKERP